MTMSNSQSPVAISGSGDSHRPRGSGGKSGGGGGKDLARDMRTAPMNILMKTAADIVEQQVAATPFLQADHSKKMVQKGEYLVPVRTQQAPKKYNLKDISLGKVLGRGGFCIVREVEKIKPGASKKKFQDSATDESGSLSSKSPTGKDGMSFGLKGLLKRREKFAEKEHQSMSDLTLKSMDSSANGLESNSYHGQDAAFQLPPELSSKKKKKQQKYVLKRVSLELKQEDRVTFMKGAIDLAMEAKYLIALNHPNIIELHGISSCGMCHESSFLIVEKLPETLSKRIKNWCDTERRCKGITGAITGSKRKEQELLQDRITTGYEIALAVGYLHSKDIIYRDLKPDNIGYDCHGILKIFDFGLAKQLTDDNRAGKDLWNLTGLTGSIRYMAPEVGLSKPYNLKADVHSWSMILWFIFALEPPFGLMSENEIFKSVFERNERPLLFKAWHASGLAQIMESCWNPNLHARPTFTEVASHMKQLLYKATGGDGGSGSRASSEEFGLAG